MDRRAGKRQAKSNAKKMAKRMKRMQYKVDTSPDLPCLPCAASIHEQCMSPYTVAKCCCFNPMITDEEITYNSLHTRGGQVKEAADITDVQSTGRKRAAEMYPITDGMICEWMNLKEAGGGVEPIIGCLGNKATDRHHGPDKNTLNNKPENVHLICSFCHNFWHAHNDKYYGERPSGTEPFIPLDSHEWCAHNAIDKATIEEVVKAQLGRRQPK